MVGDSGGAPQNVEGFNHALPALLLILERPPQWFGYSVGVLWTLQYEMVFYLLSGLAVLLLGSRLGVLAFSALCLGAAGVASVVLAPEAMGKVGISNAWFWCSQFSFGSLLAYTWRRGKMQSISSQGLVYFVLGLALLVSMWDIKPTPFTKFSVSLAASFASTLLIAGFLLCSDYQKYFGIPQFVGKISYSIYLVHAVVLDYGARAFHLKTNEWGYFFPTILLMSCATYMLVEKPGIMVGNSVICRIFPSKTKMA